MQREVGPRELKKLHLSSADHASQATRPILPTPITQPNVRRSLTIGIILQLTAITFLTSISSGLMTISIPRIASDLDIQPQLYYW